MFLRSFKLFLAALLTALLAAACGNGDSAPAPTGLAVSPAESSATITWDMRDGVEYWLFFGPTAYAPSSTSSMQPWFGLPGGNVILKVTSPYVVSGLPNGMSYTFTLNGRISGGPGGPGATPVAASARLAGVAWSAGASVGNGNDLRSATWAITTSTDGLLTSSHYVAAGVAGTLYTSTDGIAWTAVNSGTSSNFNGAAYFGSFKLVGDGGAVLLSTDAVTWSAQNSGTTQNLYAIASNGLNLNVAVGANGTIITSADGITWTPATTTATSRDLYAVNYSALNGGTWLAVGAGGTMVKSTDGLSWSAVASGSSADLRGISYGVTSVTTGTGTYVAVGTGGTVLSSADGVTWSAQTLNSTSTLNAVLFGLQFVAVGNAGVIFTSTDGLTWTPQLGATNKDLYAIARGSLSYLAVGAGGSNLLAK